MSRHDIVGSGLHSSQDTSDIVVDRKAACEEAEKDPRKVIMGTTPSGLHGQDDSVCVYWSQPTTRRAKSLLPAAECTPGQMWHPFEHWTPTRASASGLPNG